MPQGFQSIRVFFSPEDLRRMNKYVERAASELRSVKVNIIAYVYIAGSFIKGREGERNKR